MQGADWLGEVTLIADAAKSVSSSSFAILIDNWGSLACHGICYFGQQHIQLL